MQAPREYLVAVGRAASLGRFVALPPLELHRDDPVVVRTDRGLEVGRLLRAVSAGEGVLPYRPPPGEITRVVAPADRRLLEELDAAARDLANEARQLAGELALPLEVLEAEPLLEPRGFLLHILRFADADLRPFTSQLSRRHGAAIHFYDLTQPSVEQREDDPGCGSCSSGGCGEGGCGSCSTGGGCSTGCGTASPARFNEEWREYFAELREQMGRRIGMPLR